MSIELALLPIAIAAIGAAINKKKSLAQQPNHFAIETRMTDARLLEVALQNCGCRSIASSQQLTTAFESAEILFQPAANGAFDAVFSGEIEAEQANAFIGDVFTEYTRLVQEDVYLKLKQRAAARGMMLESEQLQNDNSITLTFCLQKQ
jgi:hypothetical protein